MERDDEVAIVGIGCNFPGGEGIENFWKVLVEGRNCTVEVLPERFNVEEWYDADENKPGKIQTRRAAFIEGLNEFDNNLFGISDSEAERLDPQHKLLLECSYRALESAGVPVEQVAGSRTGVFIGIMNQDYGLMSLRSPRTINHYTATGHAMSLAANRISYAFNLTGPSLAIDTACSSSLVALYYAFLAIKQGDCEAVLCGGVSCMLAPAVNVTLSKAKMISPDGVSKPFSSRADGYGRGEGCGVILLKPLKKALEDHNPVWGVIDAIAVNQDGRTTVPITRPSQRQQESLLQSIYGTLVDPLSVQYIEAHGTGTPAGDLTEAESLGNIVGGNRSRAAALKIGSVKGNIGHAEAAAGVAGLIKVLLMMHYEKIVPSLHYSDHESIINTERLRLAVPTSLEVWEESQEFGRRAGVNGFGFGGTNVHVVLRQWKQESRHLPARRPCEIFVLSGSSRKSLQLTMEDLAHHLGQSSQEPLQNLAYTAACRRSHRGHPFRKAFAVISLEQLRQQLHSAAQEESAGAREAPPLIFICCGNGCDYPGMGKSLLKNEPVFRKKCQEIAQLFLQYNPRNLLEFIENECEDISSLEVAQPLLFILQVALVSLLRFWGVIPSAILGFSLGEVAAAHCAGVICLEDAVKVIHYRSRFQAKVTGGKMMVVRNIPVEEIAEALAALSVNVCISSFSSPYSCMLSGDAEGIAKCYEELAQQFGQRNVFLHILSLPVAYHSNRMDPILKDVEESIGNLIRTTPDMELISTVTGKTASEEDFITGKYWSRNIREPVRLAQALTTAVKGRRNSVFVEIAPRIFSQRAIRENLGEETIVIPSLQPNKEYAALFELVKSLFELGHNLNWSCIYEDFKTVPTSYPRYQFEHKNLSTYLKSLQSQNKITHFTHPLISSGSGNRDFTCFITQARAPYIFEHKNNGTSLVPGSFFVELGLAYIMDSIKPRVPLSRCQVRAEFLAPCVVYQDFLDIRVQLEPGETGLKFKITSPSSAVYAIGEVTQMKKVWHDIKSISLRDIFQRCKLVLSRDEFYEKLLHVGFQHGAVFRLLHTISFCDEFNECITTVKITEGLQGEMSDYHIHPVLLDCFLQMSTVLVTKDRKIGRKACFPSKIGRLTVFKDLEEVMNIYVKAVKCTESYFEVCGFFTDTNGSILAKVEEIEFRYNKSIEYHDNFFLENRWEQISHIKMPENTVKVAPLLVLADMFGVAQQLKKYLPSNSQYIEFQEWEASQHSEMTVGDMIKIAIKDFHHVLFMWGIKKLKEETPGALLQSLTKCCEAYHQLILALKDQRAVYSVTVVTYRTTITVDHVNPGFTLAGMTRASLMEVPNINFQMIDINDTSPQDIKSLAEAILKCRGEDYPELSIHQGKIAVSEVGCASFERVPDSQPQGGNQNSEILSLYTSNPYNVTEVTAELESHTLTVLDCQSVEVKTDKICIHSEDYFPVSTSSSKFGDTLYWAETAVEKHKLLALDFSGTVTAIGKDVNNVKVGDHVATCFPVVAASKVLIPDVVCFHSKTLPALKKAPCVSYFILAWKILTQVLPNAKHLSTLAVISSQPRSVLGKVLTLAAKEVGWKATLVSVSAGLRQQVEHCQALVLLPSVQELFMETLSDLPHLRDTVFLCGKHQPTFLYPLLFHGHNHIKIHLLSISQVLQKSCLISSSRTICQWLTSMNLTNNLNFTCSSFQQNALSNPSPSSYFMCVSIPLVVLDATTPEYQPSLIPVWTAEKKLFKANGVYVVSGGLTGLGFETVKFIVQGGGGSVVTLSRRNPTPEQLKEMQLLENQNAGCRIVSLQCDICFHPEVEKAVRSIGHIFPKSTIKGIFHSAVVLDDGPLEALSASRFEKVLNPKVAGALNLHLATKGQELDYFVCYSSVAAFIGNSAQANYAAANSFLDVFCRYRRNIGLAGQSINWGPLNLGLLQNKVHLQSVFDSRGILTLQIPEIHEYLEKCLSLNNPQQAIIKLDFRKLKEAFSHVPSLRIRFSKLYQEEFSFQEEPCMNSIQLSPQMSTDEYVFSLMREFVNTDIKDITMSTLLTSLGIDSLSAITIQSKLFHDRKVQIPLVKLLDPDASLQTLKLLLEDQERKA